MAHNHRYNRDFRYPGALLAGALLAQGWITTPPALAAEPRARLEREQRTQVQELERQQRRYEDQLEETPGAERATVQPRLRQQQLEQQQLQRRQQQEAIGTRQPRASVPSPADTGSKSERPRRRAERQGEGQQLHFKIQRGSWPQGQRGGGRQR